MIAPREKLWSTPHEVIIRAAQALNIDADDIFYDIGCGDGAVLFYFAEHTSAKLISGVEINESRVNMIRSIISEKHLETRCRVIFGNALEQNYSDANAIFLYLVPRGLRIILPLLKQIPHKVKVATYMSPFPDSEKPIEVINISTAKHEGSGWPLYIYVLNS